MRLEETLVPVLGLGWCTYLTSGCDDLEVFHANFGEWPGLQELTAS